MNGQQLKNSILQMAVQGKLVPQDPNDEPASVLIQRIRKEKEKLIKEKKIKKEKNPSYIFRGSDNLHYEKIGDGEPVCIEEQIPFEIPNTWEWVRLISVCTKLVDGDHNPPKGELEKTQFIMASSTNINNDTLVELEKVRYLSEDVFRKENERTRASVGDILFTSVGSLGRSCIFDGSVNICFQRSVSVLSTMLFNQYLKYFFDSGYFQQKIVKEATGTAQKGFYLNQLAVSLIPVPPLAEQQRIVAKIEQILPHIREYELSESRIIQLNADFPEQLKKSILQEAVQGKLVPQDPSDEPASILLEKIAKEKEKLIKEGKIKKQKSLPPITEDEIPFDIPNTWVRAILRDVCFLSDGEKISGTTLPYLDAKYLRGKKNVEFRDNGKLIFKGEYAILVDGENSGEVFSIPEDGIMGSTFKKLIITPFMEAKFILYFLEYYRSFFRNNKKGAAIPHLNKELFAYTPIGIPPLEEQKRIVAKIEELMPLIEEFSKA